MAKQDSGRINLTAFMEDIRAGADDSALMEKYGLSPKGLKVALDGLVKMGRITRAELDNRVISPTAALEYKAKCPGCGSPQPRGFKVCARCGYIVGSGSYQKVAAPGRRKARSADDTTGEARPDPLAPQTYDIVDEPEEPSNETPHFEPTKPVEREDDPDKALTWTVYKMMFGGVLMIVSFLGLLILVANFDTVYFPDVPAKRMAVAAYKGDIRALERYLADGADVNSRSPSIGFTPLMWASVAGHDEAVMFLLDRGADVNAKSRLKGNTALMLAVANGREDTARLLLDAGANPNVITDDGQSPLSIARLTGKRGIEQLLARHGAVLD